MKYKTRKDIDRLIALNKPNKVIEGAITSHLTGVALQPILAAEARHAELLAQPDLPDVPAVTDERQVLVQDAVYDGPDADGSYVEVSPAQHTTEIVTISEGYSPNAIRDGELADLVMKWPHLADETLERPAPVLSIGLARPMYKEMIAARRYAHETGGVAFDGHVLDTGRDSVAMLDSYMEKLRRGVMTSVSWKCVNGDHVVIDATNMDAVEAAVLGHIAAAFTQEEQLCAAVDAATTVAELPTAEQMSF